MATPTPQQCTALRNQFVAQHPEFSGYGISSFGSLPSDPGTIAFYGLYPECRPSPALDDLQIFLQNRASFHPEYIVSGSNLSTLNPSAVGIDAFLLEYPQYLSDPTVMQMRANALRGLTSPLRFLSNPSLLFAGLPAQTGLSGTTLLVGGIAIVGLALILVSRARG